MSIRTRVGAVAVSGVACTVVGLAVPAGVASAAPAPSGPRTVTVTVSKSAITFAGGTSLHAGTSIFKVVTPAGDHELQLLQLHKGYSLQQAGEDFNRAFSGNVAAVRRVDKNVTFFGGAEATPSRPGEFSQTLRPGTYYALDQDSNALTKFTVSGTTVTRAVPHASTVDLFTYGFGPSPASIPHAGRTLVYNHSDQPHFLVLQQVKQSTTNADVEKFIKSGGQGNPSWALKPTNSNGVLSPSQGSVWSYNLPKGKYLMACFWPDADTGMPHFFMGMYKLVELT